MPYWDKIIDLIQIFMTVCLGFVVGYILPKNIERSGKKTQFITNKLEKINVIFNDLMMHIDSHQDKVKFKKTQIAILNSHKKISIQIDDLQQICKILNLKKIVSNLKKLAELRICIDKETTGNGFYFKDSEKYCPQIPNQKKDFQIIINKSVATMLV